MLIGLVLVAHVTAVASLAVAPRRLGRGSLAPMALLGAITAAVSVAAIGSSPEPWEFTWVAGLDLVFRFQLTPVAAVMAALVGGIGSAVAVYAAGYLSPGAEGTGRFATTLLAFATSMLALVTADSAWALFIAWELTSITSFLLVGHKRASDAARTAARQALVVTAGGGLVLLAGLLVLVDATGTPVLSQMTPVGGGSGTLAAVLVLIAAATKSAQVPFHVWLPGAMAAPTPVSAYLHSATMVKAGVLLVALLAPVLGSVPVWSTLGLTFGIGSMVWGAVGALRHVDAKLILAWGTVSQLGLLVTLLALGKPKATFAALSMLVAHAVFKAALFMVVGEIDVRTGTRDIRTLSGLGRSMPVVGVVAVVSGLSMAGVPPLLGFATKEAAIEAVLGLSGADLVVVGGAVIGSAVLTVAYTTRLLLGLLAGPTDAVEVTPARLAMTLPAAALGTATVAGFAALGWVSDRIATAAAQIDPEAGTFALLRWPGLTTGLLVSLVVVVAGAAVGVVLHRRVAAAPRNLGADALDRGLDAVPVVARRITTRVQHGSLPLYLATMTGTAALATVPFIVGAAEGGLAAERLADSPAQAALAAATVLAAIAMTAVRSRLGAALGLGAVGIGVTGLFVVHGAPDLALTQLLVETVVVVGFVAGLRRLPARFPEGARWHRGRIVLAGLLGAGVSAALLMAGSAGTPGPPTQELVDGAVNTGGGNNVVNVILTDVRALDTVGEVLVLVVVAIGVVALGRARRDQEAHP